MRALAAAAITIAIIMIIPSCGGPLYDGSIPHLDDFENRDAANALAGWEDSSSGTGAPRAVDFNGMKVASGTSVIDSTHPGYIGIDPPLGWSSEQLEGQLDHLSMWVDDVLVNPNLDANHEEILFPIAGYPEYNGDPFFVPDGWTFVKNDALPSGTQHPQHGYFELNGRSGEGYDGSIGWRFDANYGSSTTFDPSMGIYMSQQVPTPWREIYSAEITFLYYVSSISVLNDEVFIFTRLEDFVSKHHVFETGIAMDTWLQATAIVPTSYLQSLEIHDALLFDIGLGTDMSGLPAGSSDHEVYIDEIEMKLLVRPYPEQIDLRANGARVTGSTQGSISPYVPDGSNRDCYSAPNSNGGSGGVDLDGYAYPPSYQGYLDVGADVPAYPIWDTAYAYQVGLQFPIHIPQGSTITTATLQVETPSDSTGFPGMRIYVANEDTVSAFSSGYPLLPDRYDWVNTSIYWRPSTWLANGRYDTPDLSALIQEVVARPGWQSGNYICIMIDYAYSNQQYANNTIKGSAGFPQGQLSRLYVDFTASDPSDVIPSFRYNKNIIIEHTRVASDLQNFPVLVDIWDADLHLDVQPDGDDIAFLYNGQVIPHEIDVFDKLGNGTHAHLSAWVNVPYVSSVQDTTIVMVYGDDNLGNQENTENVWDSDFSAVWHLRENPAQPQWSSTYADYLPHQPQILDVTSLGNDGISSGSMTSNDLVGGFIGDAIDLEGTDDYIDFANPTDLQMNGAFTVEAWFYADFVDNDYLVVKSGESNFRGWDLSFDDDPSISPAGWVMFRWSPDGVAMDTVGYHRVDIGQWYHVVGVFSPSEYTRFYVNGELVGEVTSGIPATVNDPNRPLRIGRRSDGAGATSYFDGIVDEVRLSSIARSDAWIMTQYNNQRNPELFMSVGEEGVNFRYMKDIIIDHNKVPSDLTRFPVLIDIFDTDLRTDVQADGDDIMFTSNGRSLPHEIELFDQQFNSTHGHLIAWVKADLSSASDTVLTMYYGNPSIGSQEDPTGVWSNKFYGVWHLGETTGDALDSTFLGIDGTLMGGPTRGIPGTIGYAYEFDGGDDYLALANAYTEVTGTYSFWLYPHSVTDEINFMASEPWLNRIAIYNGRFRPETAIDSEYFDFTSSSIAINDWQHIVFVRAGDFGDLYIDGAWVEQVEVVGATTLTVDSIGGTDDIVRMFDGIIDEPRISTTPRSADWVITEYNNQYDPSSFYSLGSEREVLAPNEGPVGFVYKKYITIDHNKVDTDLSGFPVLIDLYDTDLRTDVQADGDDIVFVRDGWILPHEIELFVQSYNTSHAHLVAWVRTDLSALSDTVISLYYGNPTSGNQENPTGVWDTSFGAVWHLSEDPAGTIFDSTLNNNDGIGLPGGSEPTLQTGKIDGCAEFYGEATNDRIETPHTSSLVLQSDILVEAWVRTSNTDGTSDAIVAKWGDVGHRNYWLGKLDGSTLAFFVDNTQSVTASLSLVNDGYWHHVVGVANAASGDLLLYVDGIERASASYSGSTQTGTSVLQIANNPGSTGFIQEWDGRIDEVRVSRSYRSPGWILTEFNNQNDPDSFYSVSSEIVPSAFGAYDYRKKITITTESEPVSVGYSTSLVFDHGALVSAGKSQANGDDIRIAYWNGSSWNELDRVLDSDSSWNTGNTKIWFQIQSDIIASSSDDRYYIYYGDSTAEFPPNDHANIFQFYDGFESGDLSGWDANSTGSAGDDISAITSPPQPNTGTYSARCEADNIASAQAMVWEDFADEISLLARTHIYLDPSFSISGGGHVTVMQFVDTSSGWQNQLAVTIRDDLTLYVWNAIAGEAYGYGTTSTLSTGTWYMLEVQATISDTDGEIRLWLDGTLEIDETGKNIGTEGIDRYCAGFYWASPQTDPNIVYADDAFLRAFVSPEPITSLGPELAQTIQFNYKKDIVVDNTKIDSDLTDFPLLIDIYDSDLKTDVQSSGNDIIFRSGELSLSHEIELFDQNHNSTHAHLVAWVKTDLSSTVDTTITMHYGNAQAPNQEDPNGVWNAEYWGVWHLGETSGNALDSTSGGTDGILSGNPTQGVAGSIGYACDFDGADDYAALQSPNTQSTGTYSFWIYPQTFPIGPNSEVNILASADTLNRIHVYNNMIRVETATNDEYFYFSSSSITTDAWQHVVFARAGDFGDLYVNGAWVAQVEMVGANVLTVDSIGGTDDINRMFDGPIDEVHISTTALSADWIAAEYRNQNDPASFFTVGPEVGSAGPEPTEYAFKKDITIDNTKVSTDLNEFPLLIDIYDTDLKTDVQSDGDDIIFQIGTTALPHEIELFDQTYNSTHAHLVAWVKTDLSSSVDTTISMYYGNSNKVSQERPSDVWNSNYVAVWHMNQDPSSSDILDSTRNGYDLSTIGFGSDQRIYDERSGVAISVDGIDDRFGISGISGPINDFTFQSWFRFDNTFPSGSDMTFFRGNSLTNNYPFMRFASSSGKVVIELEVTSDPAESSVGNTASWAADAWYQFAFVRSMSAVRAYHYVNGSLDGEDNSADNANPHLAWNQLVILSDFGGGNMWGPGAMSEFRILNTSLSPDWIAAEYANQNDPASFYSVGVEEQISSPQEPSEPSILDATGYQFTTSSNSSVAIGVTMSIGTKTSALSYADDLTPGTSFSIVNDSLAIWTANVLVSPPPELETISFELSYPEGEWYPLSVKSPSGIEKAFATDWTCFDGRLIVGSSAIDEYGFWRIQFQDRNYILDTQIGPTGGPYTSSGEFSIGDDIEFRVWNPGTISSTIPLELTDPSGSVWYSGTTSFQGKRFTLPYHHRKYLTISHDDVASDLVNFPVLVDIYDTDLRTDVRTDGRDIAFAIGEETLTHELELFEPAFNSTHAHLVAWVKVPSLSGSSDTVISMYYGNPMAPIVYDSGPVWDSGYLGVWHLSESGTGALDEYLDSSQYKHHGTGGEGNTSFVPTRVSGKIGSGQDFNNIDGYYDLIDCGDSPLWNIDGYQITLEAWVQHDITPNTHVYGIMNHKGWYDGYALYINYGGGSTLKPTFSLPGQTHQLRGANDVTGGAWHHIVATYDGSLMRVYVDGVQDPNVVIKTDEIMPSAYEQGFWIGHGDQPKDKGWSAEWEGQIDEVRISDIVRSAGWIQTEFQNQNDPSSFYSVGVEESAGYSESEAITLDSSAPAGVWQASARYRDSGSDVDHRAGLFVRNFVVKHGASLNLTAPGDAVSDGISAKQIGDALYIEYNLTDILNSDPISGATLTMNWTVSGTPTDVQLNDYGDGSYGRVLNTTDLGAAQRWRIELSSHHQFYNNATSVFFLDLSHDTYLTYEPPSPVAYGDDFTVKVTLRDSFNNQPLANAGFASSGTLIGLPVDYGNGTYLLTIDSSALSVGEHNFSLSATPADSYLLSSSIDVQFNYRNVITEGYSLSSDPVEVPWGEQATVTIFWYDLDHSGIGIEGGTMSIIPSEAIQTVDVGSGYYTLSIDMNSYLPGTYVFDVTISKANYEDTTISITVIVQIHRTSISADYNPTTPVGTSTYFDLTFLDIDGGSTVVGLGNMSQVTLDWGSGPQVELSYNFWLDTSAWSLGVYTINITVYATTGPRYYSDATISVELEIRKLEVYMSWEHLEPFPNGDDFVIFVHLNVSEPGTPIDGTPIDGLTQGNFTTRNETGSQYTLESFTFLGDGRYRLVIDQSVFQEGDYTIVVYVDFLSTENYIDTQTPVITFTYRPILAYLSSVDYPTVTTTYDTNVTITLNYVDIDNSVNITTGMITAEGASITWQHLGDGLYEVLIIVQGWNLGSHEVNITADALSYQAKTLTFEILVQIAYAYARSSTSSIDLPVGDTAVFFVDYWDIIHDEPILGAAITHNWTHALTVIWTGLQYRIELPSYDSDVLGSYFITFNVSSGSNYQFGYFNVSLLLRTHYTEFRLGSAVEPTTYIGMVNVSLYYGDLDNTVGIVSQFVNASVYGESGWIDSILENDTGQGNGFYILRFSASVLGESGIYNFTVYFNWTGAVQKFYNGMIRASVNIIGEESELSLEDSSGPTPYLQNMSYSYFYGELYSGVGISNSTGDVFIFVDFIGVTVDLSQISILEGIPGLYTIEFNTTLLTKPGVYSMVVYVNWSASVSPFYDNRTDTISVRVIPRSTVISVTPPDSTAYGVNATFSFSFDDVSDIVPVSIGTSANMTVIIDLSDYTITYNSTFRRFYVSFNTSVLGASIGSTQFAINITWIGSPFYSNVTGRTVLITVTNRPTSFDFATPTPSPYGAIATFTVTFMDIAGGIPSPINDGVISLFNDSIPIPGSYYTYLLVGNGQYSIELNNTYFTKPGSYILAVQITTSHFYYADVTASRTLNVQYRLTTLSAESVGTIAYNSSIPLVMHYKDLLSFAEIGNASLLTSIEILNGSSWLFSSGWSGASQEYLVTVQTHNQGLDIGRDYVLWIRFSYSDTAPFYLTAETFASFRLRERTTFLDVTESPLPAPYLDSINFTVLYSDLELSVGIDSAEIGLSIDAVDLVEGTDYILQEGGNGIYYLSVNTTTIGPSGTVASLLVRARWTTGAPYYTDSSISLIVRVTTRSASVNIISSPSQVRYLDNITFTFRYIDDGTAQLIVLTKNMVSVYNGGILLQQTDFMMLFVGNGYELSINSTIISPILVTNWNVTVFVDWASGVAPYYSDDASSVGVTITNRIGSISIGSAPTTPIGDNMTLSFSYSDTENDDGIGDAIVEFDCISPSGLVENADYWIVRGIGVNFGEYTILVDSTKLSGVGLYTFSLRLLWNPSSAPFYRNTTEVYLLGSVRLIQSLLTNDEPSPSTVPINDNVSVVLTFTDLDHSVPIVGAQSNITVTYKSDGSIPSIWSISVQAAGVYVIVVNCTDAGSGGTNALVIRIDMSAFQFAEVQVPIQIRARQGELIKIPTSDGYFGVQTFAIVELVDLDASSAPIPDATLSVIWPEFSSSSYIGSGRYNITLDTTTLDAGLYTLVVSAQKANYFIPDISISIRILSIPTEIILPQTIPDVYWGENVSIWSLFNDTRSSSLISGATVVYQINILGGSLTEGVPAGNYSFTINTGNLPIATAYVVSITANLNNYVTATGQVTLHILRLDLELTVVDGLHDQDLHKGESINITVFVRDVYNDVPLLGATVSAIWVVAALPVYLSPVPGMDGYYTGFVATQDAQVKTYTVVVRAGRTNYVSMSTSVEVRIRQIPTEVWLDSLTSTYSSQEFNWSDTIRIGIYVLVPSLNESYPYSTGLSNCTVVWSLSGTFMTGDLVNGTQIGGPGYFYYDFRSWEYNATTFTIRITSYPNVGAFASSSNITTLTIKPIETAVESSYVESQVWGWSGWVNLTYTDLLYDRGVTYANGTVDWEGNETIFRYLINSTYQVWVNTSLVRPGVYPVVVSFWKQNYEGGTGVFTLTVEEVPTDIIVYAPNLNQVDDSVLDLVVPFGDVLPITLFYNDTWYNQGIPNATERTAVIMGPSIPDKENLILLELAYGNYSIMIDSSLWSVSSTPYRVVLSFNLENRSRAILTILVTIINIPTGLTVDHSSLTISYSQTVTVWVYYYDDWPGHSAQGIAGGFLNATSLNEAYVSLGPNKEDESRLGWYEITLQSGRLRGSAIVTIELSKEHHDSAVVSVAISVVPSELDVLFESTIFYGLPIAALCIIGAILWSRLFSLPKLLREIRGMVKSISKGRIPKVPEGTRTRRELITELFNEIAAPIGLVRLAESMPDYSLAAEVPEIEEIIIQLSILTELTPEELVDFRADVSKMRLSEQVAFVKEVINQEAIRRSKIERKSMEKVIEETLEQARAQLAGKEIVPVSEPEVFEEEVIEIEEEPLDEEVERIPPEMPKAEDELPPDLVSAAEIKEIRKQLVKAGIEGVELETIMEQVRNLPRELVGDLIDSILQKGGDKP